MVWCGAAKTNPFKHWLQDRDIDGNSWEDPTSVKSARYKVSPTVYTATHLCCLEHTAWTNNAWTKGSDS